MLVGLFAFSLLSACGQPGEAPPREAVPPVLVRVETLTPSSVEDFYESAGTVRARQRAVLAARIGGTLQQVLVRQGDAVREGQTLAVIEDDELRAEISRAEAAKSAAEAARTQAEQGLVASQAEAHMAELTYQRFQDLLEKRSASRQEFDQAEARHRSAQAALEMASAGILEVQAHIKQAEAALRAARIRAGYSSIAAPFAGVVVEKHADAGTVVAPGTPLLTLDSAGGYQLETSLPESRVSRVRLGDAVRVSIPAIELEATGRVEEIEAAAEAGSRTSLIKIGLAAREAGDLRSGLFGRAFFSQDEKDLLAVPEAAVLRKGQLTSVFVVSEGVARQRLVTLGRPFDGRREVLSGLASGEQIVVSDPASLVDGSPVEVRP